VNRQSTSVPELTDYYAVLEIAHRATADEVRAAYRRLARAYHPDANSAPEAADRMRRLNEAWETLRDPQKRALYDRQLPRTATPRPMRRPPPPRPAAPRANSRPSWFEEDSPREASRPNAAFTGDASIDWYSILGVRPDANRQEILKVLARMAATLDGAAVSATEFTRRRTEMKQAWEILGDPHSRAAYDRARRQRTEAPPPPPEPPAAPPAGYRVGPVNHNGLTVDKGVALPGADLRGADLRGLDLAGIDLRGARLQGVNLESASLRSARLGEADLSGANLHWADLSHADCSAAALRQADLSGSALHATNFFRANMAGASLENAIGPGINLDYADLSRADLTHATITLQLIERAKLDQTTMPDGSRR